MTVIYKTAVVPFTAAQMYSLVNDIESYPEFLPWCHKATILTQNNNALTASISLTTGKITQSFTTENIMKPDNRIDMDLVEGPFKFLRGTWLFEQCEGQSCKVSINMDYEFRNRWIKYALDRMFGHIINTLITTFTNRAFEIYGRHRN